MKDKRNFISYVLDSRLISKSCLNMSRLPEFARGDEIVVSGMSGRFPKSCNIEEFERNLYNKVLLL